MKHSLPPLDTLKVFEAAARHLSFSLAADELCISKGAVSYQIRKLEQWIQCPLFKRSVRQVYLTDSGQVLFQTTRQLFDELEQSLSRLSADNQQAAVAIATSTYVASRWLSPRIAAFNECYPEITTHLQHSVNSLDFKLMEVDMAIRWGVCNQRADSSCLRQIPMSLFPAISPALLQKTLSLSTASVIDLPRHAMLEDRLRGIPLLCEDRQQDLWQEWLAMPNALFPQTRRVISDANVRVQAAIDGQGWILADDMMKTEIERGLLVTPFAETLEGYGYTLLHDPGRIINDSARKLRAWLVEDATNISINA